MPACNINNNMMNQVEINDITVKSMIEHLNDGFINTNIGPRIVLKQYVNGSKVFTRTSLIRNKHLLYKVFNQFIEEEYEEFLENENENEFEEPDYVNEELF